MTEKAGSSQFAEDLTLVVLGSNLATSTVLIEFVLRITVKVRDSIVSVRTVTLGEERPSLGTLLRARNVRRVGTRRLGQADSADSEGSESQVVDYMNSREAAIEAAVLDELINTTFDFITVDGPVALVAVTETDDSGVNVGKDAIIHSHEEGIGRDDGVREVLRGLQRVFLRVSERPYVGIFVTR